MIYVPHLFWWVLICKCMTRHICFSIESSIKGKNIKCNKSPGGGHVQLHRLFHIMNCFKQVPLYNILRIFYARDNSKMSQITSLSLHCQNKLNFMSWHCLMISLYLDVGGKELSFPQKKGQFLPLKEFWPDTGQSVE